MIDWDILTPLTSLTQLDGRNSRKLVALRPYFSEFAWMKLRLGIMISYTQYMAVQLTGKKISPQDRKNLDTLVDTFSLKNAEEIIRIEAAVNHDLKAIELYFVQKLTKLGLTRYIPYVNLGIGSEDINSIALGLQLMGSRGAVLIPKIVRVIEALSSLAQQEKNTLMIARTHGQPANVTTFGKELTGPLSRLCDELELFRSFQLDAKCSGEVGSLQAFIGIDRTVDWLTFTDTFVGSFRLHPTHAATQIAPYDSLVRYLQSIFRINNILLDLAKNMWLYVLLGYLKVKKIDKEVGSSGMPHKINPIYFEGAEGGLEMANGVIEALVRKLPINRLQRDFSDSTIRRNIVVPLAYSMLSYQSICEALDRIDVDRGAIERDLDQHAEVWTETIKAYGTTRGIGDMYERLKKETRGRVLSQTDLQDLIAALPLKQKEKQELRSLCGGHDNPYSSQIVEDVVAGAKKIL